MRLGTALRKLGFLFALRSTFTIFVSQIIEFVIMELSGLTGFDSRQSLEVSMPSVVWELVNINIQNNKWQ